MAVVLTGGTGLVGAAVLRRLVADGDDVLALVRSESSADAVQQAGAEAVVGDLQDADWVAAQVTGADGVIHTASPGDASSAEFDSGVAVAVIEALKNTGKPYVHTGGIWVYGSGDNITEADSFDAPALTAWRAEVEEAVLTGAGVRSAIVVPAVVYGDGQGLPAILSTPDDDGNFRTIGDGQQHWATVHADDLADLYLRALRTDNAHGYYIGAGPFVATVRELVDAAADVAGTHVTVETPEESRARLGAPLADALMLDQIAGRGRAIDELGWKPTRDSLEHEIRTGSYRPKS